MSAFLVSHHHPNALVNFLLDHAAGESLYLPSVALSIRIEEEYAPAIGSILYGENVRSVYARYSDTAAEELVHADDFAFERRIEGLSPLDALGACACYEYQACESPDWGQTDACAILRRIECVAIRRLPGYDDAPWEIREPVGRKVLSLSEMRPGTHVNGQLITLFR